jgi:UDP-4-amino-4,6-dideoxy-N-acetyl-beta-L-altrosamine transaminase
MITRDSLHRPLPYGRQSISEDDIQAVIEVLRSDWLTTGPAIERFERTVAEYVGAEHAVAVSSGTAALHAMVRALGIRPGDEVIVPPITFAATANAVVYEGGIPVFVDVEPDTLLLDVTAVADKITPRTRAIIAVDYAGQPCDYHALRELASKHSLALVADGCHALGATQNGRRVGAIADMTAFSFHPVKHITTGEGGMVTTNNAEFARHMRQFRNHGISTDFRERAEHGSWFYEMRELGYNYRLTDMQCALGMSQMRRLDEWLKRRCAIAAMYDRLFSSSDHIQPLAVHPDMSHAYHLYVVKVRGNRKAIYAALRRQGIGVNVHYIPVHLHPFYQERFGTRAGMCPNAEAAYESILSLPMFPDMSDDDVVRVGEAMTEFASAG